MTYVCITESINLLACFAAHKSVSDKCQVEGCAITPRVSDMGRHDEAEADGNTEIIYRRGFTKNRLPTFNTHAGVKTVCQPGYRQFSPGNQFRINMSDTLLGLLKNFRVIGVDPIGHGYKQRFNKNY